MDIRLIGIFRKKVRVVCLGGGLGGSLGGGQNVQGGGQQSGQQVPVGPGQGNC